MVINALRAARRSVLDAAVREYLRINPGKTITDGPFTWDHHGVATRCAVAINEERFAKAYEASWSEIEKRGMVFRKRNLPPVQLCRQRFRNELNIHVAAWAAEVALSLDGDFVEIGVGAGIFSRCIMRYLDFDQHRKTFWLVDRWSNEPLGDHVSCFVDDFETAQSIFAPYKNVVLVQGMVPNVLHHIAADRISYLYIDLNAAEPELATLEYLWPRLVKGAIVISDDFGFPGHESQRDVFKSFCARHHAPLLYCPTGQGVAVKV